MCRTSNPTDDLRTRKEYAMKGWIKCIVVMIALVHGVGKASARSLRSHTGQNIPQANISQCPAGMSLSQYYPSTLVLVCGPCAVGKYSNDIGRECKKCAEGTYQDMTGTTECKIPNITAECNKPILTGAITQTEAIYCGPTQREAGSPLIIIIIFGVCIAIMVFFCWCVSVIMA